MVFENTIWILRQLRANPGRTGFSAAALAAVFFIVNRHTRRYELLKLEDVEPYLRDNLNLSAGNQVEAVRTGTGPPAIQEHSLKHSRAQGRLQCRSTGSHIHLLVSLPERHGYTRRLRAGYRPRLTKVECVLSVFRLPPHTESCNCWTHIVADAYCIALYLRDRHKGGPSLLVLKSAIALFTASTVAHALAAHGPGTSERMFQIDRAMIAVFFWCGTMVVGMMHFRHPRLQRVFKAANIAAGASCVLALLFNSGPGAKRAINVAALGTQLSVVFVPLIRELVKTRDRTIRLLIYKYTVLAIGWALLGGIIYARQLPESLGVVRRGTLDVAGHGHNIMHVFVAFSVRNAYVGICKWRYRLRLARLGKLPFAVK